MKGVTPQAEFFSSNRLLELIREKKSAGHAGAEIRESEEQKAGWRDETS